DSITESQFKAAKYIRIESYALDAVGNIASRNVEIALINTASNPVTPVITDITIGGGYGVNAQGQITDENGAVYVHDFSDGLARVAKDGKYGFVDTSGKLVMLLEYDGADDFREGLARVYTGGFTGEGAWTGKMGFIDKKGKVVVPSEYDIVGDFIEGLAVVLKGDVQNGKWGIIDKKGKVVLPVEYGRIPFSSETGLFSEGLVVVQKDGKWGILQLVK
ncbi:MAG: WG repeat-containing protein, partial [Clostridiales bacterium]|nr:WG repeat-containing protein [Clostridiales bacterium]